MFTGASNYGTVYMGKEMNPSYAFTEVDANGLLHFFCDAGGSCVALDFNGMFTKPEMILLIFLTATLPLLQKPYAVHGGKLTATGTQETMPDKPNSLRHRGYVHEEESATISNVNLKLIGDVLSDNMPVIPPTRSFRSKEEIAALAFVKR